MDVRHAPPLLRRLTDVLAVLIAVALLSSYLVGRAVGMGPREPVEAGQARAGADRGPMAR